MKKLLVPLLGLLLLAPPAWADRDKDSDRARRAVQAGEIRPLSEALAKVEAHYPGRVLDVELEDEHAKTVYEVKVLTGEGQVLKVILDARNLDILKVKGAKDRGSRRSP